MILHKIFYWTLRITLGATFLLSGFLKAVDPYGTAYKLQDYLDVWGFDHLVSDDITLIVSVFLSSSEVFVGICFYYDFMLLVGIIGSLSYMAIFIPITLWLALLNPISDCGCFGDAIKLTNWQTFWKNIIILLCLVFLYKIYKRERLINNFSKVPFLFILFPILLSVYSIYSLPVLDFRPYHIGADIKKGMSIPQNAKRDVYKTIFFMEKDGETKKFTLENYPDASWTLLKTEIELLSKGYEPPIVDFSLKTANPKNDVTDSILSAPRIFLLLMPSVETASKENFLSINELYKDIKQTGTPFYAVTSSTDKAINKWAQDTHSDYPFLLMDGTTIKTIIRSSPGLVMLEYGIVKGKWSHHFLPKSFAESIKQE